MIFKKMELTNFRQFKGKTSMEFSTDPEKNVTIIIGDNGSGKTTLLQAFNWCLYGKSDLDNSDELLNKDIENEMNIGDTQIVEVEIIFEHLEKLYTCRNTIKYTLNEKKVLKKSYDEQIYEVTDLKESGETKKINQSAINAIFPSNLSTYFLFDGERMQNLADNQRKGKKDLSLAVKNLLGLEALERSKADLQKVKREFEDEFVVDHSPQLESLNDEITELNSEVDQYKSNLSQLEDETEKLEEELSKINDRIIANHELKTLQTNRNELNKQSQQLEEEISEQKNEIYNEFNTRATQYFLGSTFQKFNDIIEKTKLPDKVINGINGHAIEEILERERCICGNNLVNDPEAKETLEELKKFLPPESYTVLFNTLKIQITEAEEKNKNFYDNFEKMYKKYNKLFLKKDTLEDKISENERKIKDIGDKDTNKDNEEYLKYKNKIDANNQQIGFYRNSIKIDQQKIAEKENKRSNLTVTNDINEKIQCKIDICNYLINIITDRLNKNENIVKDQLQNKASELLGKMLASNKMIEIQDNYNFMVSDEYNTTTLSEGEKIVSSFAFVGAIISVAKDMIGQRNKEYTEKIKEDTKFTLVMDAPFSKLDEDNRKGVIENLPKLTNQIILFTLPNQLETALADVKFHKKIGQFYYIHKEKSGISNIDDKEEQ